MLTREQKIELIKKRQDGTLTREDKIALLKEREVKKAMPKDKPFLDREMPLVGGKIGEQYVRPALQALGAVGGGVVGGTTGAVAGGIGAIPGAVAGSGLGYAGAEEIYRMLKGGDDKTLGQSLADAGRNVVEGGAMEAGGMGLSSLASKGIKAIPTIAKGYSKTAFGVPTKASEIIAKNPEAVKEASKLSPYKAGENLISDINKSKFAKIMPAAQGLTKELTTATEQGVKVDLKSVINNAQKKLSSMPKAMTETTQKERATIDKYIKTLKKYMSLGVDPMTANELKRQIQAEAFEKNPLTNTLQKRKDVVGDFMRDMAKDTRVAIEQAVPGVKPHNKTIERVNKVLENKKFQRAFSPENVESTMKNLQSDTGNKEYLQTLAKRADSLLDTKIAPTTENVFAAKYLQPGEGLSLMPTGRSGIGIGTGAILGGIPGAVAGTVATSPMTYRTLAPVAPKAYRGIVKASEQPFSQAMLKSLPIMGGRDITEDDEKLAQYRLLLERFNNESN